jgi:hypothetical protein
VVGGHSDDEHNPQDVELISLDPDRYPIAKELTRLGPFPTTIWRDGGMSLFPGNVSYKIQMQLKSNQFFLN